MVQSKNMYYKFPDAQLQVIHAHTTTSLRPSVHVGIFLPLQSKQLMHTMPVLMLFQISTTVTQQNQFVSPISNKCAKKWPLQHSDQRFFFHKWNIQKKYIQVKFLDFSVPMWLAFVTSKFYCGPRQISRKEGKIWIKENGNYLQ
jgi:hypothetical protein